MEVFMTPSAIAQSLNPAHHTAADPQVYPLCRHLLADGRRCHRPALKDRHYCYWHNRDYQRKCVLRSMTTDPDIIEKDGFLEALDLPAPEDVNSLLVNLAAIYRATIYNKMDPVRVSQALRNLRIMTDLVRHVKIETPPDLTADPDPIRIPCYPRFEVDTGSGAIRDFDAEFKAHKEAREAQLAAEAERDKQLIADYHRQAREMREKQE
jgi:hypothetical protein